MQAPKSLRRPENWQDFETLCEFLWGEIWKYPEIKKNGRPGQKQNGVDISGIPSGQDGYYGIQCKKKSEYLNTQFTDEEILEEIEMAKSFQPPLKKLYLATTAIKNAKIEEFVRIKNIEHIKAGLFEVHIYCWEDISALIDRYPQTHAWYVKSKNFKTDHSVSVTFHDGSTELVIVPKFNRLLKVHVLKSLRAQYLSNPLYNAAMKWESSFSKPETRVNLSYCKFNFQIHNTGTEAIEDYKMSFKFDGKVVDLARTNEEYTGRIALIPNKHSTFDTEINKTPFIGEIIPETNILVSDDVYRSSDIFLKPAAEEYNLPIEWKLISKYHSTKGILNLIVKPQIDRKIKEEIEIKDKSEFRVEELGEDMIEIKETNNDWGL